MRYLQTKTESLCRRVWRLNIFRCSSCFYRAYKWWWHRWYEYPNGNQQGQNLKACENRLFCWVNTGWFWVWYSRSQVGIRWRLWWRNRRQDLGLLEWYLPWVQDNKWGSRVGRQESRFLPEFKFLLLEEYKGMVFLGATRPAVDAGSGAWARAFTVPLLDVIMYLGVKLDKVDKDSINVVLHRE